MSECPQQRWTLLNLTESLSGVDPADVEKAESTGSKK